MHTNLKTITNLKKARSHIDKIISMEESGKYCIDIIQQLNAIIGYINSAKMEKLEAHLHSCFASGMKVKTQAIKKRLIDEVIRVVKMTT